MTMQMLESGGLDIATDGIRKPGEDNPKGYYEYERVKDLEKETDKSYLEEFRGKTIKVISFLLKDLPETNNYKVLFMRRDLPEVLASQKKMLERRGQPDDTPNERMLELWNDHLWRANYHLRHSSHFEFIELPYKDVVERPMEPASGIF